MILGSASFDLTEWLFREEKLHSAVLAHLLAGPHGDAVAAELLLVGVEPQGPSAVTVKRDWPGHSSNHRAVRGVELESPVTLRPTGKKGRKADLSCGLEVNGEARRLVVEAKVDSHGGSDQLRDMSWDNDFVLLVALGTSAFDRSQDDLDHDAAVGFVDFHDAHLTATGPTPAQPVRRIGAARRAWPMLDPRGWQRLLEVGEAGEDVGLAAYVTRMSEEARLYDKLRAKVDAGGPLDVRGLGASGAWAEERTKRLAPSAWALAVRKAIWRDVDAALNATSKRDGRGTQGLVFPAGWGSSDAKAGNLHLQFDAVIGDDGFVSARGAVKASGRRRDDLDVLDALDELPNCKVRRGGVGDTVTLAQSADRFVHPCEAAAWTKDVIDTVDSAERTRSPKN